MLPLIVAAILSPALDISFSGGNDYDLCRVISQSVQKPVAIVAEPGRVWKAFNFNSDPSYFDILTVERGGICHAPGKSWGLSMPAYPLGLYFTMQSSFYTSKFRMATVFTKSTDGRMSVLTANGAATLGQIFAKTQKPVRWHWFFDNFRISAYCLATDENTLVQTIADAIGAQVVDKGDEFYLDFNPKEYRKRALSTIESLLNGIHSSISTDLAITRSCLIWMTDEELSSLFESPGKVILSNPPLASAGRGWRTPTLQDVTMEIRRPLYPTNSIGLSRTYIKSVSLISGSVLCTTTGLFYRNTGRSDSVADTCFDSTKAFFTK